MAAVVADQCAGDAEHDVALEVRVVVDEDLRDERLEVRPEAEEVDVRGPVRVPVSARAAARRPARRSAPDSRPGFTEQNAKRPAASVVSFPRRFMSAWVSSWFS